MPDPCTDAMCPAAFEHTHVTEDLAAPDRPGDRDQQQAAEVLIGDVIDLVFEKRPAAALRQLTAALAAARAEEAARWQAKIEALCEAAEGWDRQHTYDWQRPRPLVRVEDVRRLLDAGQPAALTRDVYGCACENPSPSCRGWVGCNRGQGS